MLVRTNQNNSSTLLKIFQPFQEFARLESFAGILLLGCTIAALALANSPLQQYYSALWHTDFSIGFDKAHITKSLHHWINDGLMCVFFFVVGLEIKRELVVGELASFKQAAFPVVAAIGGMIVPAFIYFLFNAGTTEINGWGIPMATDIAFSLGILTLLGSRVPVQLKIFLTAFAIVDDLGAILVIAFFYGTPIQWVFIATAGVIFLLLLAANRGGIHSSTVYLLLGLLLWFAMLESGIHATIAGVLLAITIPVRPQIETSGFAERIQSLIEFFRNESSDKKNYILTQDQQAIVHTIESSCKEVETPLHRLEHRFHPWVTYAIMPLFAFANAGVVLEGNFVSLLMTAPALGIIFGLIVGKVVGITFFSWIAVKLKFAVLPQDVSWKYIFGASCLGGIGFTMSLFIANLAFSDEHILSISKIAILTASFIAGIIGFLILKNASRSAMKE